MKFILPTFVLVLLSYAMAINTGLLGDDITWIVDGTELKTLWNAIIGTLADRPLLMTLIWLQKSIYGLYPMYLRIANIGIHTLASWQLFKLIQEVTPLPDVNKTKIAAIAAVLFAIHPLHSQTLMITIQTGVTLAGLFGILSFRYFLIFTETGKKKNLLVSVFSLILAFLSKPIIAFLPIFYLLVWMFLDREKRQKIYYLIPYFCCLLIPVFYYAYLNKNNQDQSLTQMSYFLTQAEVLLTYFKLMIFPYGLKYLYDFNSPENASLILIHLVIISTGLYWIKGKSQRLLLIGFYLSFTPESSFFPIKHIAWEHRTYFPMIFITLLISTLVINNAKKMKRVYGVTIFLLISYLSLNQIRNQEIRTVDNWMVHTLQNSETHHNFNFSYASILIEKGNNEIGSIIEKYRKLYPNVMIYKVLISAYDYRESPSFEKLKNLTQLFRYEIDFNPARLWLNAFLIRSSRKDGLTFKESVLMEETIAKQLVILFKSEAEFKQLIAFYRNLAISMLEHDEKDGLDLNKIEVMRIKAVLTYYYNQRFKGLEEAIKNELYRNPHSDVLIRINELVSLKKQE